jgi:endonuclease G
MARRQGRPGIGKTILALILVAAAYYFLNRESGNTPPETNRERKTPRSQNEKAPRKRSPERETAPSGTTAPTTGGFDFENEAGFGQPVSAKDCQVVQHQAYALCYAETYEQPYWVAYRLSSTQIRGAAERENDFRPDPEVGSGSATPEDYRGTGYDRGHLAPAADFKSSPAWMSESFFMSNMSPQAPDFNRGIWETLESRVREWVRRDKLFYVVTGPVLKRGLPKIGKRNQVAVPEQYYKIILHLRSPEARAIAFLMRNEGSDKPLKSFAVSIDKVEQVTGLDFFPQLPDELETSLESTTDVQRWFNR